MAFKPSWALLTKPIPTGAADTYEVSARFWTSTGRRIDITRVVVFATKTILLNKLCALAVKIDNDEKAALAATPPAPILAFGERYDGTVPAGTNPPVLLAPEDTPPEIQEPPAGGA